MGDEEALSAFNFTDSKSVNINENEQRQPQRPQQREPELLLNGKLKIFGEINLPMLQGDAFVNFCASDILSGDEMFLAVHEHAGVELKDFCAKYQWTGIGSCRLSNSFGLSNFKKIVHCILPRPVQGDDLIDLDELVEFDLMLCYRNALDSALESGCCASVVFTHPMLYGDRYGVAKLAIATISHWLEHSHYAAKLDFITIACPNEEISQCYMEIAADLNQKCWDDFVSSHSSALHGYLLNSFGTEGLEERGTETQKKTKELPEYDEAMADVQLLDAVFEREYEPLEAGEDNIAEKEQKRKHGKRIFSPDENEDPNPCSVDLNQFCMDRYGFDLTCAREHADEVYDLLFRSPDGIQLQLSRNLAATILTIEEERGGQLRQYRMTTQNRDGETLYFRCSKCESLMRYTNEEYRPKITVKDGFICGPCFPAHHPQCYSTPKELVIIQQLDRQARLSACQDLDAYLVDSGYNIGTGAQEAIGAPAATSSRQQQQAILPSARTLDHSSEVVDQSDEAQMFADANAHEEQQRHSSATIKKEEQAATSNINNRQLRSYTLRPNAAPTHLMSRPLDSSALAHRIPTTSSASANRPANEVPIVYKKREVSESATLRAIRMCENELEGRGCDELERQLLDNKTTQERLGMWKHPWGASHAAQPIAAVPIRNRVARQQDPFELAFAVEEMLVEEIIHFDEQEGDEQQVQSLGTVAEGEQNANQPSCSQVQSSSTSNISRSQWAGEQSSSRRDDLRTARGRGKGAPEKGRFSKFRVIRKRGGKTNMAFDWREAESDSRVDGRRTKTEK